MYVNNLITNFAHLSAEQDKLIWTKNTKIGKYTTKRGYEVVIGEQVDGVRFS